MDYGSARRASIALAVLVSILFATPAQAQLSLTLSPTAPITDLGSIVSFAGTLTNTSGSTVYINGDDMGIPGLTWDETPFALNAPLSLDNGMSYTGTLFTVTVDPTVAPETYSGSFTVLGGADQSTFNEVATQPFQVTVLPPSTAVPEPSPILLLVLCLPGLSLIAPRYKKSAM